MKYGKTIRRAGGFAAALLILLLAVTLALVAYVRAGSDSLRTERSAALYYRGEQNLGVLLVTDGANFTALVGLFREMGAHLLVSDGSESLREMTRTLSEISGLPSERMAAVGAGPGAGALMASLDGGEALLGVALVRPDEAVTVDFFASLPCPLLIAGHADEGPGTARYVEWYNLLTGDNISPRGRLLRAERGEVALQLTPSALLGGHLLSRQLLDGMSGWIASLAGLPEAQTRWPSVFGLLWVLSGGLLLLFLACRALVYDPPYGEPGGVVTAAVSSRSRFLMSRMLVWPAGLAIGGVLALATGGRLFLAAVAGPMLALTLLYRLGAVGVSKLPEPSRRTLSVRQLARCLPFPLLTLASFAAMAASGLWIVAFGALRAALLPVLFALFYIGARSAAHDLQLLYDAVRKEWAVTLLMLLPYLPLVMIPVLAVPLGLLEAVFSDCVRTLWMLTCSLLTVKCVLDRSDSVRLAAACGALLLSSYFAFLGVG